MRNEVYGEAKLDISLPVISESSVLGMLEAAYKLDDNGIMKIEMVITDNKGNIHNVNVNGWEFIIDRFIGEGEDE